jgi:hypothetical protein
MSLEDLLKRTENLGWLDTADKNEIERFRHVRNAYAHFRPVSHELNIMQRVRAEGLHAEDIVQDDARTSLRMGHFVVSKLNGIPLNLWQASPVNLKKAP